MVNTSEFPKEVFLKLDGQDYLEARLTINKMRSTFWVEIDVVQKESRKIWAHIGDLHHISDEDEAVYRAVQMTADYLKHRT